MKKKIPEFMAIIPARGGSKGIKDKNLQLIDTLPLFAHVGLAASAVSRISKVVVSSDSDKILSVAETYGFDTVKRPAEISGDTASTEDAVIHALETNPCTHVVLLQPTSPMLKTIDLERGLDIYLKEKYDSVFSAAKVNDFLIWDEDSMYPINYDPRTRGRRQKRKRHVLLENGAFYIFNKRTFDSIQCRMFGKIGYSEMPFWRSLQIDDQYDLSAIRTLMTARI